jgi:hypothetical protein
MKNVNLILDQLVRIAIAIRQSGTHSQLQKADRMLRLEDHQDLRTHLITIVLSRYTFSPEQIDLSTLSKLSPVQLRLIDCNLKRRNRFLYAQKHSKGLDAALSARIPPPTEIIDPKKAPGQPELKTRPQQKPEKFIPSVSKPASAKPVEHHHNPSMTSASGMTDQPPPSRVPSQASTTQLSTTVTRLDYPHPPEIKEGAQIFRCPCCCQVLPVAIQLDSNRWR